MPPTSHSPIRPGVAFWVLALTLTILQGGTTAEAANPRWTTGPPYFTVSGTAVLWYTAQPLYYTDPGDLSSYVNHAAADAMVAAAANTWNVPVSSMVLQQGGSLDEQVSSANVYLGSGGLVFPADVQSNNYAAKQIAIIYDRDGSVTDLLLGGGASSPSGCLQNAVTESVDSITPSGYIQHAVLILNGRCTGPAPEKQLQMQYQLERAFGRVLGLGWSQLNDNVFMGSPQPTYNQTLHWPIMHPIDVICGMYTYQCLPEPFTLRDDDLSSLIFLYPVPSGNVPAGKQASLAQAARIWGGILFDTYEGMGGVNVVLHRKILPDQVTEQFDDVSAVTGIYAQQLFGNPITPKPTDFADSLGAIVSGQDLRKLFDMAYVPITPGHSITDVLMKLEPINPLYTGQYAIGPYPLSPVTPSGDVAPWSFGYVSAYQSLYYEPPVLHGSNVCDVSTDGTETAPTPLSGTGWWNGLMCSVHTNHPWRFDHTSWVSVPVRAHRSLTVEMTALDEAGYATGNKVRPVVGIWKSADAIGSRPSLASSGVAFNSVVLGMTTATGQTATADTLRIVFAAENGDGRPDYNYQARVLYADSISPAAAVAGTQIMINGSGFRPGNTVTINGIRASVASWTANTITATVPRLTSVLPGGTATVDVTITDLSTQGTTIMSAAFQYTYTAPTYLLQVVTAPGPSQIVTLPATPALTVQVIDADGVTPLPNTPVVFSTLSGLVAWSACSTGTCTILTDANGRASITVTPLAAGTTTLQAAAVGQTQQVSFQVVPLVRTASVSPQYKYLAAGAVASWPAVASFTQQGQPAPQTPVVWATTGGNLRISAAQTSTSSAGTAQATVQAGPIAAGAQATGAVCAWGNVCGNITAFGVGLNQLSVIVTGNGTQTLSQGGTFVPVMLQITDTAGNPVAGATVNIHQTTRQWTVPCSGKGRCPIAPMRQSTDSSLLSDSNGNLSLVPLDMGGAEVTSIVVASGSQGYVSLTLQRQP